MSMSILRQYLPIKKRQIYTSKHVFSINKHISTPFRESVFFLQNNKRFLKPIR
jgi:hypothetical protein